MPVSVFGLVCKL